MSIPQFSFSMAPQAAMEYLASKGVRLSFNYDEMMHEAHHKAFTVAKVTKMDLLIDIFDSLQKAQGEGTPFAQWKKELKPTLQKAGWWGETTVVNEATGEVKDIYVGSRRLKTIYYTNMRVANAVGRYQEMMELPLSVYWKYHAIADAKARPSHLALNGMIRHRDDPFWNKNFPPNAWNCRCTVKAYSKGQIAKNGWKVSGENDPLPDGYDGPHPDWAYNVGAAGSNMEPVWNQKLSGLKDKPQLKQLADKEVILDAQRLKTWFNSGGGNFEMGKIGESIKEALDTKASAAVMSSDTLAKQKTHHADIEWYEYLLLNEMLDGGGIGIKDGENTMVALESFFEAGAYYLAALKATKSKEAVFITSFRRTNANDIDKKMKNGEVLWDKR